MHTPSLSCQATPPFAKLPPKAALPCPGTTQVDFCLEPTLSSQPSPSLSRFPDHLITSLHRVLMGAQHRALAQGGLMSRPIAGAVGHLHPPLTSHACPCPHPTSPHPLTPHRPSRGTSVHQPWNLRTDHAQLQPVGQQQCLLRRVHQKGCGEGLLLWEPDVQQGLELAITGFGRNRDCSTRPLWTSGSRAWPRKQVKANVLPRLITGIEAPGTGQPTVKPRVSLAGPSMQGGGTGRCPGHCPRGPQKPRPVGVRGSRIRGPAGGGPQVLPPAPSPMGSGRVACVPSWGRGWWGGAARLKAAHRGVARESGG